MASEISVPPAGPRARLIASAATRGEARDLRRRHQEHVGDVCRQVDGRHGDGRDRSSRAAGCGAGSSPRPTRRWRAASRRTTTARPPSRWPARRRYRPGPRLPVSEKSVVCVEPHARARPRRAPAMPASFRTVKTSEKIAPALTPSDVDGVSASRPPIATALVARAERNEVAEIGRESDAQGAEAAGVDHQEVGPAEQETDEAAVGLGEVDVLAAGPRHQGRKFREVKAPASAIRPPTSQTRSDEPRRRERLRDERRRQEDARTDRPANRDHRHVEQGQGAAEGGHKKSAECQVLGAKCCVRSRKCQVRSESATPYAGRRKRQAFVARFLVAMTSRAGVRSPVQLMRRGASTNRSS